MEGHLQSPELGAKRTNRGLRYILSFETGLDWGDNKITLHHDLDTEYLVASILDVDGGHTGAGEYLDMNFDSDVVTKKIHNNKTQLIFDANNNIAAGQNVRETLVG